MAPVSTKSKAPKPSEEDKMQCVLRLKFTKRSLFDRCITLPMVSHVANCIAFSQSASTPAATVPNANDVPTVNPIKNKFRLLVRDADNPVPGFTDIALDIFPPIIDLNRPGQQSTEAIPKGLPLSADVTYTIKPTREPFGELLMPTVTVCLPVEKERGLMTEGFFEVMPLQGWHARDCLTFKATAAGVIVHVDGLLVTKEGNVARLTSSIPSYLRVDFGKIVLPGDPPGPQIYKGMSAKKLQMLLRGIYFKHDWDAKADPNPPIGKRVIQVAICEGSRDNFGRLEVQTVSIDIDVVEPSSMSVGLSIG